MVETLPAAVYRYLQRRVFEEQPMACVRVDQRPWQWHGDPVRLGLTDLAILEDLRVGLPPDQELVLPLVHVPGGASVQVHQILAPPETWLLLLPPGAELDALTAEQQQAHELALRNRAQEQLIGTLEQAARVLAESEQELRRAATAQELFIRGVAHELGTPLTAVTGHLALLHGPLSAEAARRTLQAVQRGVDHLQTLLQGALDRDRLQRGRLRVQPGVVDLPQLLREVADLLEPQAEAKGLRLQVRCESMQAWVDVLRLRQILINLLSNAIKYTERGQITLSAGPVPEGRVRMAVIDQGSGLTAAQQARMFEPYERFHAGMAEGQGLGLYITQQLAEAIGARLGVHSVAGSGSTFWLELPDGLPYPRVAGRVRRHWLLVDDDQEIRELLDLWLQSQDRTVRALASLTELRLWLSGALEARSGAPSTRVFTDVGMLERLDGALVDLQLGNGETGFEVLRHLRGLGWQGRLVAMSADDDGPTAEAAMAAGADAFVAKPFQFTRLLEVLDGNAAG